VVGKILENDTYAYGFDAQTSEFGNHVWSVCSILGLLAN
jgi:hypothetical protein